MQSATALNSRSSPANLNAKDRSFVLSLVSSQHEIFCFVSSLAFLSPSNFYSDFANYLNRTRTSYFMIKFVNVMLMEWNELKL